MSGDHDRLFLLNLQMTWEVLEGVLLDLGSGSVNKRHISFMSFSPLTAHARPGKSRFDSSKPCKPAMLPQPFLNEQSFTTACNCQCLTAALSRTAHCCKAAELCRCRRNGAPGHCQLPALPRAEPPACRSAPPCDRPYAELAARSLLTCTRASSCLPRHSATAPVTSLQPFRAQLIQECPILSIQTVEQECGQASLWLESKGLSKTGMQQLGQSLRPGDWVVVRLGKHTIQGGT